MASTGRRRKELPCLSRDDLERLLAEEKNGKPNYGAIQRYHRLLAGWTGCDLSIAYTEALEALGLDEDHLISQQWIYTMEKQNRVPHDEKRRWILAQLLNIPPVLFGLSIPSSAVKTSPRSKLFDVIQRQKVDVAAYRTALETYNHSWMAGSFQDLIPDMKLRILSLQNAVLDARSSEKQKMLRLLCEYYTLLAKLMLQTQEFDPAIACLSKAISIAETNKLYHIWAYALRQRAMGYLDRAEITAGLVDFATAHHDFAAAVQDFMAARNLEPHLSSQYKGIVYLGAGSASAYVARDKHEFSEALKLIELGGKMIETGDDKDGDDMVFPIVEFDGSKYHLDRGKTLIAPLLESLRSPVAARQELKQAGKLSAPSSKVRHVSIAIRQAESYYIEGEYPAAVNHAEQALKLVNDTDSTQNLARLQNLYNRLRESSIGKSSEVALFGVNLLKAQHPAVFGVNG